MNTANFLSLPGMMLADQEILVFEGKRQTYGETLDRVRRLASSLKELGVGHKTSYEPKLLPPMLVAAH